MAKQQLWVLALVAGMLPLAANAQPQAGENEILISGSGSSDKSFDNNIIGATGSWGVFVTDQVLVGIRQSVNVADSEASGSSFNGITRGFIDYHFDLNQWQPYIGASAGGIYGEDVNDSLIAGLDAGIKYYVLETTFIALQSEYQFTFDSASGADEAFDDGGFLYSVGIGYNF